MQNAQKMHKRGPKNVISEGHVWKALEVGKMNINCY